MHRSGTSLLARVLSEQGIFMGNDVNIHHESKYFLQINENILSIAHSEWDYPKHIEYLYEDDLSFQNTIKYLNKEVNSLNFKKEYIGWFNYYLKSNLYRDYNWGWKDPRTTITFPLWRKIYPNAKFIYLYRNGIDVAASLYEREINRRGAINSKPYSLRCLSFDRAFELWEEYNYFFFEYRHLIANENIITFSYEELLKEPNKTISQINNFLGNFINEEQLIKICQNIKPDNANKFLKSEDLKKRYLKKKNTPVMKSLNYDNIN